MSDLGVLPKNWTISTMEKETEFITDYVANGSFKSLADNVNYKDEPDYAYLIRLTDFNNGFDGKFVYVNEDSYNFLKKSKLFGGEIIISNVGAYAGTTFLAPKLNRPMTLGPNSIMMNFKNGNTFYYYWLKSPIGKFVLDGIISGSAQPKFNKTSFRKLKIPVPPLEEQKAIAEVLSSLDDKIELLHRQNKTLEELAQTLFRQWFIEEAKDEWEVGKLPDEFSFTMGLSPKGETFNEEKIGIPMYQGNADFEFRFPKNRVYTTDPKRYAEKFDTLVSVRAPVGAQNMAKEKCCIGRGVASFRYKKDSSFYTYTYFKMKSLMDGIKQFNDSGTVFGSINKTDFQELEISIPPENLVKKYQNEVKPLDDKVIQNTFQIKTLEDMRDTLLPKLMSGEVRISI